MGGLLVSPLKWTFRRCGMGIVVLLLVRCVDPRGVLGLYSNGLLELLSDNTTVLIVVTFCAAAYMALDWAYQLFEQKLPALVKGVLVLVCVSTFVMANLLGVMTLLHEHQPRKIYGTFLILEASALMIMLIVFNINTFTLHRIADALLGESAAAHDRAPRRDSRAGSTPLASPCAPVKHLRRESHPMAASASASAAAAAPRHSIATTAAGGSFAYSLEDEDELVPPRIETPFGPQDVVPHSDDDIDEYYYVQYSASEYSEAEIFAPPVREKREPKRTPQRPPARETVAAPPPPQVVDAVPLDGALGDSLLNDITTRLSNTMAKVKTFQVMSTVLTSLAAACLCYVGISALDRRASFESLDNTRPRHGHDYEFEMQDTFLWLQLGAVVVMVYHSTTNVPTVLLEQRAREEDADGFTAAAGSSPLAGRSSPFYTPLARGERGGFSHSSNHGVLAWFRDKFGGDASDTDDGDGDPSRRSPLRSMVGSARSRREQRGDWIY